MKIPSEPCLHGSTDKWIINMYDGQGNYLETHEYESESDAKRGYIELMARSKKDHNKTQKKTIEDNTNFLEEMSGMGEMPSLDDIGSGQNSNYPAVDNLFGDSMMTPDEFKAKIEEHKTDFERKEEECKLEANKILNTVAQLYMDANIIDDNDYVKFKLQLEGKTLASLVFQLDMTRGAAFKLSEKIHTGEATKGHYEVFNGLQRVILDITKYQSDHLTKLEDSMKQLREDLVMAGKMVDGPIGSDDGEEVSGSVLATSDRRALMADIDELLKGSSEIKIPQSRNKRLHDDDPSVHEVDNKVYDDENFGNGEDGGIDSSGLMSWGNEDAEDDIE